MAEFYLHSPRSSSQSGQMNPSGKAGKAGTAEGWESCPLCPSCCAMPWFRGEAGWRRAGRCSRCLGKRGFSHSEASPGGSQAVRGAPMSLPAARTPRGCRTGVASLSPRRVALSIRLEGRFARQAHLFPQPVAMATGWLQAGRGDAGKKNPGRKSLLRFFFF